MNSRNDSISSPDVQEDVLELGIASVETKGALPDGNEGIGHFVGVGITE